MSDLIDRDNAIDAIRKLPNAGPRWIVSAESVFKVLMQLPSAEPTWADVLAELHERFDALEKEIRRASAEVSAIIREYVDRPKGENLRKEYPSLFECSHCGASCDDTVPWDCDINFCPNCGADMRERGGE